MHRGRIHHRVLSRSGILTERLLGLLWRRFGLNGNSGPAGVSYPRTCHYARSAVNGRRRQDQVRLRWHVST